MTSRLGPLYTAPIGWRICAQVLEPCCIPAWNESVNSYDAVVTKVNTKTFNAICEGEDAQVPITKYPDGVWHFPGDGPVVDDVEFENFKLLNSGPVSEEPQKSSWSQIVFQQTATWKTTRWT